MKLSAEEVLTIAVRAEENAARMYEKMAEKYGAEREVFTSLAEMEKRHKHTFRKMQDALEEKDRSKKSPDPFSELQGYLEALADAHGGEGRPAEIDRITGKEKLSDIIDRAVELEKNSILYYQELAAVVPEDSGRNKLDTIIIEEKKHVVALSELAGKYRKKGD
jgi:rubrerythrin